MPSIALLVNRESGAGRADEVEDLLAGEGAEVRCFDVHECEAAAGSGADRIVVAGGDGSIGFAAAAASAAGVPIAVIAAGTANDFAAGLGLPDDLAEASRLAVRGTSVQSLELARVGDRPFVNIASVGLSPTAAEHAHGLKGRLGALAYPLGAIRAGFGASPIRCRVACDGGEMHDGQAWQVSVGSVGAFGGGASIEADATDGKLDLVVIDGSSRIKLIKHAYGMRIGSVEGQKGVLDRRCNTVELRLDGNESLNVDGELIPASELAKDGSIHFEVEAEAFDLVVG
jgi:diacylglycerol kinase family enzyme